MVEEVMEEHFVTLDVNSRLDDMANKLSRYQLYALAADVNIKHSLISNNR